MDKGPLRFGTVAALCKARWRIERFFKCVKRSLRIEACSAGSSTAHGIRRRTYSVSD